MKKLYFIAILSLLYIPVSAQENYTLAYDSASYALSHAKKALKANNFDHQKYYSGKALKAYEKIVENLMKCDCEDLSEKMNDIMSDVENAAYPVDWDRGRYYSKKVYKSTQDLITTLDLRTAINTVPDETNGSMPSKL